MLTKEQKLEVLSKAIDEGANINVYYYDLTKEGAKRIVDEVGEVAGLETKHYEEPDYQWYKFTGKDFDVAAFYDKKPKEVEM